MKKVFVLGLVAAVGIAFSSCEKCATCTSISEHPATFGDELTEQVCGKGRNYEDNITIYTRSGWECAEN
jgi:hypothetical protein